ncbi:3-carboxymuconate cyclase [Pelomyxa schiedti]|nr:3-carboxymuconate cyclase [Pelomyxa schiedti]
MSDRTTTSSNDGDSGLNDQIDAGMYRLARCYLYGEHGVPRDEAKGVALLQRAAHGGDVSAMLRLARCHWHGWHGLPTDREKAIRLFEAVPGGGGMWGLGWNHYNERRGATYNVDKAVSAWKKGAELGEPLAQVELGWCYQNACIKLQSHWRMAQCYLCGEGVERDWEQAVELLKQCPKIEGNAQAYLGWCYLWGCGVERDMSKAVELLNSALLNKWHRAGVFLGCCYERGLGVRQDINRAKELYNNAKKSSLEGTPALTELGVYFLRGDCGAPTDKRAAVGYFRIGAGGGDPVSMFHLGVCLRDGDGVGCDLEESRLWLEKAARLEHRGAQKILLQQRKPTTISTTDGSTVCSNLAPHTATTTTFHNNGGLEEHRNGEAEESLKQQCESLKRRIIELEKQNEKLQQESKTLERRVSDTEEALSQQRKTVEDLRKDLMEEVEMCKRYKNTVDTMTSLISATAADFRVEKLLGTGSNAAAFKVQYITGKGTPPSVSSLNNRGAGGEESTLSSANSTTDSTSRREMVMKVLFNWENTPQQTMLRQKYMAECVILSLLPNHSNVIHPLGALVLPCLPSEFVEKIPSEKKYFREELCNNKSLAILMPHCGITLSAFLSSSFSIQKKTVELAHDLLLQGLKAIHHIESHSIVHRDIKEDNILVDPESVKLTLIDFGEAQHCLNTNLELAVSTTTTSWGNTGTMPPELSVFLKSITRGTSGVFSYSKCDSFALALTFWDALLPTPHKFIGSTLNRDMSVFNTHSLLSQFPVPSFSSGSASTPSTSGSPARQEAEPQPKSFLSRVLPFTLFSSSTTTAPTPQVQSLPTSTTTTSNVSAAENTPDSNNRSAIMVAVQSTLIGLMNPDKAARLSTTDAIPRVTIKD